MTDRKRQRHRTLLIVSTYNAASAAKIEKSNNRENTVNGTGSSNGEGVTFGSGSGGQQPDLGRKIVMRCFYRSEPTKRGYRKRMLSIWKELGVFEISEQRLADQARAIRTNG